MNDIMQLLYPFISFLFCMRFFCKLIFLSYFFLPFFRKRADIIKKAEGINMQRWDLYLVRISESGPVSLSLRKPGRTKWSKLVTSTPQFPGQLSLKEVSLLTYSIFHKRGESLWHYFELNYLNILQHTTYFFLGWLLDGTNHQTKPNHPTCIAYVLLLVSPMYICYSLNKWDPWYYSLITTFLSSTQNQVISSPVVVVCLRCTQFCIISAYCVA